MRHVSDSCFDKLHRAELCCVVAECELINIAVQVLVAHVVVNAIIPAFQ